MFHFYGEKTASRTRTVLSLDEKYLGETGLVFLKKTDYPKNALKDETVL